MLNNWRHIYFVLIAFALCAAPVSTYAQDDEEESECSRTLKKAQKLYDDGLIEKVEQSIKPCLESGELTKDEKLAGYKLLTLAKLYDDKDDEAEEAMLNFLRTEPEYQVQPGEPKEFAELFSKYHTSPLYTVGFYIGSNYSMPNSYLERGVYHTENEKQNYSSLFGFNIGLKVSRYIINGLNVHLALGYAQYNYLYEHEIFENQVAISVRESQAIFAIPLTFSWTFRRTRQLKPYIEAGAGGRFMISAEQTETSKGFPDGEEVQGSAVNILDERNAINFDGILGAGVKYKITRGDLFFHIQYEMGLNNQRNESFDGAVNDDERLWNFYVTDNDFTLNSLSFSVGYNLYLYKPRRKQEKID